MRGNNLLVVAGVVVALCWNQGPGAVAGDKTMDNLETTIVKLTKPRLKGEMSVEETLGRRRSVRNFSAQALSLAEVSQLLWAAQGVTNEMGHRTAPSAGATFPLACYLAAGAVEGLAPGLYLYRPAGHELERMLAGDKRGALAHAALNQHFIAEAPAVVVIAADFQRTTRRYGDRGRHYVFMEAGHAGQNVHLQCESLGLGTVCIGAFNERVVQKILEMAEEPLYLMPVGRKGTTR